MMIRPTATFAIVMASSMGFSCLSIGTGANAGDLPAAGGEAIVRIYAQKTEDAILYSATKDVSSSQTIVTGSIDSTFVESNITYSIGPTVAVSTHAPDRELAYAGGSLTYELEVNGDLGTVVPLNVKAFLLASAEPAGNPTVVTPSYALVTARITIGSLQSQFLDSGVCYAVPPTYCTELARTTVNEDFSVLPNVPIYVRLQASAESVEESGFAFADPFFSIDPQFAAANPGYSLQFSPGVGNSYSTALPEPSAWTIMLVGFGGLGGAMRWRRKVSPSPS
jgi:hypothetical protein